MPAMRAVEEWVRHEGHEVWDSGYSFTSFMGFTVGFRRGEAAADMRQTCGRHAADMRQTCGGTAAALRRAPGHPDHDMLPA